MSRWRQLFQARKDTGAAAAETERRHWFQILHRANSGYFGTEPEEVPRVKKAGDVKGEVRSKKTKQKFCSSFPDIAK